MKTAIQEALEKLSKQKEYLFEMDLLGVLMDGEFIHKSNQITTIQQVLSNLLEKEKQQIMEAYDSALGLGDREEQSSGQYYSETFKQG